MEIKKELSDISLHLSEEEYRNSYELHHSTLARYQKEGFAGIEHLFDKIESPALTKGSLLDVMLTGSQADFDKQFCVADFPSLGEKELQIANRLYDQCGKLYATFSLIPDRAILDAADEFEYQKNFKPDTKVKKLSEACSVYYNLRIQAGDKTVISTKTYEEVSSMANAVRQSPATSGYFAQDDPFSPIRRYYQQQFKANIDGVDYIIMLDVVVVDYEKKIIYPIDLKSTGKPEYLFEGSFLYFGYDIQARLYWRVLSEVLSHDEYFKDFEIRDFRFVVVNKDSLTPLVWEFPYTKAEGSLFDDKGTEYRSPF